MLEHIAGVDFREFVGIHSKDFHVAAFGRTASQAKVALEVKSPRGDAFGVRAKQSFLARVTSSKGWLVPNRRQSRVRKEQVSQELNEKLNGFLEMAAEERMKRGMRRQDATRMVRLERGNVEVAKEIVQAASWESIVETLWQDLRFGAHMLRKSLTHLKVSTNKRVR